jgi:DNA-binding MarR family transcriptional regulator
MVGRIQQELKQRRPMNSQEELFLNVQRTAGVLLQGVAELLRPHGISPTQYNVLRILRGARPDGLPCGEISARMIDRDPDITRLVDRLEKRGFVSRSREAVDRRVVTIRIADEGLALVDSLDEPMARLHQLQARNLGREKIRSLIDLLEELRNEER